MRLRLVSRGKMRIGNAVSSFSDALSTFAQRFRLRQILELGIPVLDVLLVRPGGSQEGNVIGAADPAGRNHLHTLAPGSGKAVIAIDDVEASRRDFGQQDRTGQFRGTDGSFILASCRIVRTTLHCAGSSNDPSR
jgi:hypothetical protein